MNKKKILGLDIGIASIGHALIDFEKKEIVNIGVRCFEKAEDPKTGASLALPRREKRGARRLIQRKSQRLRSLKKILIDSNLITLEDIDQIKFQNNPWQLRAEAIKRELSNLELARVLLHIAKRRGFKSSKKEVNDNKDSETGKVLEGTKKLKAEFLEKGFETIGSYLASLDKQRNESGEYTRTVLRQLLEEEVDLIFDYQKKYNNQNVSQELKETYKKIAFYQRPLKSSIELVGFCKYETDQKRAPKSSYTFEYCTLLQKINNLKFISETGEIVQPGKEEKIKLINHVFDKTSLTYKQIRSTLNLHEAYNINFISGKIEDREKEEKKVFFQAKYFHTLRKSIEKIDKDYWNSLSQDRENLDRIGFILTVEQDEKKIILELKSLEIPEHIIDCIAGLSFAGFGSLSIKVLQKIIPYLEDGCQYEEAIEKAGYHFNPLKNAKFKDKLPAFDKTNNPVVDRALAQSRKVINALIDKYGMPDAIHIEFSRDLSKPHSERRKIEKIQKDNFSYKEDLRNRLQKEFQLRGTSDEVYRRRLWEEQNHHCLYSGKYIEPNLVFDPLATEIDHAIPFSRSFNNSWNNKVLVLTDENRNKGAKTPFEYLGIDESKWHEFSARVKYLPANKRNLLLTKNVNEDKEKNWKSRAINDTRYIARELRFNILKNLAFKDNNKNNVVTVNGRLTDHVRYLWGLNKDRELDDKHHAIDAAIVASASNSLIKLVSDASRNRELSKKRDSFKLEKPWLNFRNDLSQAVDDIFISRMPNRKISGQSHQDTIRSERINLKGEKVIIQTYPVSKLKLKDLENIWDKERNFKLVKTLKKRLEDFDDKSELAFKEDVYMPTNSGERGPVIKTVKLITNEKSGIYIGGSGKKGKGIASNGDMIRTDVFEKDGKFYLIPIYAHHLVQKDLPGKYIIQGKREEDWGEIDSSFNFKFSLFKNDFVEVFTKSKGLISGYFNGTHRAIGSITIKLHAGGVNSELSGIGVKTLKSFKKYKVDVLGNKFQVKKEKRSVLEKRSCNKASKVKS